MVGLMTLLGTYLVLMVVLGIIFYILKVVACWKIFTKAGQEGWKSLIPFYNLYIEYKISWRTEGFWVLIAAILITTITQEMEGFWQYVGIAAGLISTVVTVMMDYKLAKAFGHGVGFALGLIVFPSIFELILGFGGDSYLGPQ